MKRIVFTIAASIMMAMSAKSQETTRMMMVKQTDGSNKCFETSNVQEVTFFEVASVDLGLPSGTLWASCNVGATKPEERGDYFAWGETKGYNSGKTTFNWDTYFDSSFNKYNLSGGLTELALEDDAAYVNWGSNWRMPSLDQIEELIDNCNWEWTTLNGVYGRKATSKKNGKSIFFPAAGYRYDTSLYYAGSYGICWSRTLYTYYPDYAYYLSFDSSYVGWGNDGRYGGHSVRPVRRLNEPAK